MDNLRQTEKVFKAIADRNRVRILKMLEAKPMCVCEITEVLQIAQSSVSRHLALLRDAGLVLDEKDGLWVNYSLAVEKDQVTKAILAALRRWGVGDPLIRADREKAAGINREEICGRA